MNVRAAFALLLAAALVGPALAETPRTVVVTGEAAVIAGDMAAARDQALTDARVRAIEQVAGVTIDARSTVQQELLASTSVRVRAQGAIVSEEVIEQGPCHVGMYCVTLRAGVSRDRLEDHLMRLVEEDRICLNVRVSGPAPNGVVHRIAAGLGDRLLSRGFRHVVLARPLKPDEPQDLRWLGLGTAADTVIDVKLAWPEPSTPGGGLWTVGVKGSAEVRRLLADNMLAGVHLERVTGYGDSEERARDDALLRVIDELDMQLAARLIPDELREIRVEILGIPKFAAFERLRNLLSALRWAQDVRTDPIGYHRKRTVFFVQSRLDVLSMASALDRDTALSVERAGEGGIVAKYVEGKVGKSGKDM